MARITAKRAIIVSIAVLIVGITGALILHFKKPSEFARSSWRFAGYGDPESALMTFIWATCQNDNTILKASLTPTEKLKYDETLKGNMKLPKAISEDEVIARDAKRANAQWKDGSYTITERKTISPTQVILSIYARGNGSSKQRYIKMTKVGKEWKYDGFVRN